MKDLNSIRFDYDKRESRHIVWDTWEKTIPFNELNYKINDIKRMLKINNAIRLYIVDPEYYQLGPINAAVTINYETILIGLTSDLYDLLDDDEIDFVLGHEIGHALFNHIGIEKDPFSIENLFKEISADRVGYIVCNDMSKISSSLYKLDVGYISRYKKIGIKELLGHKYLPSSTHPNLSLRIDALLKFSLSKKYKNFIGETNYAFNDKQLEESIYKDLVNSYDPFL